MKPTAAFFPIRHPELVEGSASVGSRHIFRVQLLFLTVLLACAPFTVQAQSNIDLPATNAPAPTDAASAPAAPPALAPGMPPNVATSPQEDIDDIRPPFFFLHSWLLLWLVLILAALIVLSFYLWKWRKRRSVPDPKTAYELALDKLEKARDLMNEEDPMPYIILVNETIRTYLTQRFQSQSAHQTTEEFVRQMESDPSTPLAEHRLLLLDFLKRCDLVKFARYRPNLQELVMVQQHAIQFVVATKPIPKTERLQPGDLSPATP